MQRIKKNDKVIVLTGRSKGKSGTVLEILKNNKVLVQGVNMVKRHTKQTQNNEGGILEKEAPIDLSNVAHIDPKDEKPTRIGYKIGKDGIKTRFAKRTGATIDG